MTTLPANPSRDNSARSDWTPAETDQKFPSHLIPVEHPNHDAVCVDCNYWITVDGDGVEYGHARAWNKSPHTDGTREDCPNRSTEKVDPRRKR
ncbi:hypothetical protein [Halopelagius fulvigenes]|uniref:HNH endonuclease n=1 Tax=Halopelagius fulvigenes TaxID=1198324 RepID=A0ABD5TYC9_9EURY